MIYVAIKSHERPSQLRRLLDDLATMAPAGTDVAVYDDGSSGDMAPIQKALANRSWHYRPARHHGKHDAWRFHNWIYGHYRELTADDYLFFFDDDMRLCDRFFERAIEIWKRLPGDKVTLHLMVDGSRDGQPCWTGINPTAAGPDARRTQWVDGSFLCTKKMLEAIGWQLHPVDKKRWERTPDRSTGCGEQLSLRLHEAGYGLYEARNSLLVHVPVSSQYHPAARREVPLLAQRFVDGRSAGERLCRAVRTEASLATVPGRERAMTAVVSGLLPQVDLVRVYLNRYRAVPAALRHPRIVVATSEQHGDRGDAGKFFWAEEAEGVQVICDDDIRYPGTYVNGLVAALERRGGRAVVGYHGIVLKPEVKSYYADRLVTHFSARVDQDAGVHLLGTGTVAYHAEHLRITRADFRHPNMADIWFGGAAQRQGVPMVMLARPARHLIGVRTNDEGIFERFVRDDAIQSAAVNELQPWVIHRASVTLEPARRAARAPVAQRARPAVRPRAAGARPPLRRRP